MRSFIGGLLAGAILVVAGVVVIHYLSGRGVAPAARRTVTVTGTGTVRLPPDTVRITFATVTMGESLEKARQAAAANAKRLEGDARSALQELKPQSVTIRTAERLSPPSHSSEEHAGRRTPFPGLALTSLCLLADDPPDRSRPKPTFNLGVSHAFEVEVQDPEVGKLRQAAWRVVGKALQYGGVYNPDPLAPDQSDDNPPRVSFLRRGGAGRQQALTRALAAAQADASAVAGASGPLDLLEIIERSESEKPLPAPGRVYTGPSPKVERAIVHTITEPQSDEQAEAEWVEFTCHVTVKCAY
jgi:uncharacterized protein YggE